MTPHPAASADAAGPGPAPVPPEFGAYVAALAPDRAELVAHVIALVESALPAGYERAIEFRMPSWVIPLSDYPETYNGHPLAIASLAAQKNYTSLYLNCVYVDSGRVSRFREAWAATGKTLDMGKSCVRFRSFDDLAADVVVEAIRSTPPAALIEEYERARKGAVSG